LSRGRPSATVYVFTGKCSAAAVAQKANIARLADIVMYNGRGNFGMASKEDVDASRQVDPHN